MIPYNILKLLIINGVRVKYASYDHKKAVEEMNELERLKQLSIPPAQSSTTGWQFQMAKSCYDIPQEIKDNHFVWRTGRVKEIFFDNNGKMWKFKIGTRFLKSFLLSDFGTRVKPMIFKSDDQWDLISQGFAVEETL